jgi:hypothetical protein
MAKLGLGSDGLSSIAEASAEEEEDQCTTFQHAAVAAAKCRHEDDFAALKQWVEEQEAEEYDPSCTRRGSVESSKSGLTPRELHADGGSGRRSVICRSL